MPAACIVAPITSKIFFVVARVEQLVSNIDHAVTARTDRFLSERAEIHLVTSKYHREQHRQVNPGYGIQIIALKQLGNSI